MLRWLSGVVALVLIGWGIWFGISRPMVSVILITRNRATMLPRAVNSILDQTYPYFELIVIDDASSDHTASVLSVYQYRDKRIRVIHNLTHQGIVFSRNRGLDIARGKYIAWMDDDDVSRPNRLEKQVAYLEKHPDMTVLGTEISLLGTREKVYLWPTETNPDRAAIAFLIGRTPVSLPSCMWRRSFIEKHRIRYQNDVPVSEDLPVYDAVLTHGGKIMTLPEVLYEYRLHRSNPASYYDEIADIQKAFFEKRWRRLVSETDYPSTQCGRLRYLQTYNDGLFEQSLLDNMVQTHCRDNRFNPTGAGWFLPLPNGGEWVVVSQNTKRFYSRMLQKTGVLISGTDSESIIRWDGDQDVTIYRNK